MRGWAEIQCSVDHSVGYLAAGGRWFANVINTLDWESDKLIDDDAAAASTLNHQSKPAARSRFIADNDSSRWHVTTV